jgi:hypothetical protein
MRWIWGLAMMVILVIFGISIATRILESDEAPRVEVVDSILSDESPVSVIVLNGCGVNGLAGHVRDLLIDGGNFDVVDVDDADDYHYAETLIIDTTGLPGPVDQVAQYMQATLGIGRIVRHQVAEPPAAVIVILGRDAASPGGSSI